MAELDTSDSQLGQQAWVVRILFSRFLQFGEAHRILRRAFSQPGDNIRDVLLKPLFKLSKKMTEGAYKVTDSDVEACYSAGWDDEAIMDTLSVTCLFNFMNRFVSSIGIVTDDDYMATVGERIKEVGYLKAIENLKNTGTTVG